MTTDNLMKITLYLVFVSMNTGSSSYELLNAVSNLFRQYSLHILIFLCTFFFVLTISNPAVFLNDEWITLNQLRQIDEGHQVIFNEGTYGVWKNGTTTQYFEYRDHLLAYTLMLPVLSIPALKFLSVFGDQFRYIILLIWSFIPLLAMFILEFYYPQYARYRGIRWLYVVLLGMGILLFLNLSYYYTFPFTGPTSPREIAAVVLTQHILLAMMAVVMFSTLMMLLKNCWASIFGVIVTLGCSSYFFWAGNAKDHLLVAAVFSVCIYFMIRYLVKRSYAIGALAFTSIGLLAWARTEFGFIVFLISVVFIVIVELKTGEKRDRVAFLKRLVLPLFTILGAIPLFLNNIYMTGNPLIPTSLLYMQEEYTTGILESIGSSQQVVAPAGLFAFPQKILKLYSIQWDTLGQDLWGIFILPENGAMSVLSVAPLLVLVLIAVPIIIYLGRNVNPSSKNLVFYLFLMILAVFFTYLGGFHSMISSRGIAPDMRYLTPAYLPVALLGMMFIYSHLKSVDWKKWVFITLSGLCFVVPLIFFIIFSLFPMGGLIKGEIRFFIVYSMVLLVIFLLVFLGTLKRKIPPEYSVFALVLLVSSPFTWQCIMCFAFPIAKFNGYPFWIPLTEYIFSLLFSFG